MIEDSDPEDLSSSYQSLCQGEVLRACFECARGVIVSEDDRGGTITDRICEYLSRVYLIGIEKAHRDNAALDHFVRPVQGQADKVLLTLVTDRLEERKDVLRFTNRGFPLKKVSSGQFERRTI